jgi:hypothetical protein
MFPRAFCFAVLSLAAGLPGAGSVHAQDHDGSGEGRILRFSGSGSLQRATAQISPDQRFALKARLQGPSDGAQTDSTQRFALSANLTAPKALSGSCAATGDGIFSNGFE